MYQEILRAIAGIEVYPVLSLVIFVVFFAAVLAWVARLDRARVNRYAAMPLEAGLDAKGDSRHETID
jgi:hypothetical protein